MVMSKEVVLNSACRQYCGGCRRTSSCSAEPREPQLPRGILRQGGVGAHQHVEEVWDFARGHVVTCCSAVGVDVEGGSPQLRSLLLRCRREEDQQAIWCISYTVSSNPAQRGARTVQKRVDSNRRHVVMVAQEHFRPSCLRAVHCGDLDEGSECPVAMSDRCGPPTAAKLPCGTKRNSSCLSLSAFCLRRLVEAAAVFGDVDCSCTSKGGCVAVAATGKY